MTGPRSDRPAYWLWGLLLGIITAFLQVLGGIVGFLFALAVVLIGWRVGRSLAFVSGVLIGIGATWIALIARVVAECPPSSSDCYVPDQTPWVVLFAAVLAVGALLGLAALRRSRSIPGAGPA